MRPVIQVESIKPVQGTRGLSHSLAVLDECAFYWPFKGPQHHQNIGTAIADLLYNECNKEGFVRKWLRLSEESRVFNLIHEVCRDF